MSSKAVQALNDNRKGGEKIKRMKRFISISVGGRSRQRKGESKSEMDER